MSAWEEDNLKLATCDSSCCLVAALHHVILSHFSKHVKGAATCWALFENFGVMGSKPADEVKSSFQFGLFFNFIFIIVATCVRHEATTLTS